MKMMETVKMKSNSYGTKERKKRTVRKDIVREERGRERKKENKGKIEREKR